MGLFTVNQSSATYFADFALYGLTVAALTTFLLIASPVGERADVLSCTLIGLGSWTIIEYFFHRFILHGLQPFQYFHELHHQKPRALICTPTIVSGALIAALVFLPALMSTNLWLASALTLGMVTGYLAYSVIHHATHHWRADTSWLKERKRWHAVHHRPEQRACYGVTTTFWDHVFRSTHYQDSKVNHP